MCFSCYWNTGCVHQVYPVNFRKEIENSLFPSSLTQLPFVKNKITLQELRQHEHWDSAKTNYE